LILKQKISWVGLLHQLDTRPGRGVWGSASHLTGRNLIVWFGITTKARRQLGPIFNKERIVLG